MTSQQHKNQKVQADRYSNQNPDPGPSRDPRSPDFDPSQHPDSDPREVPGEQPNEAPEQNPGQQPNEVPDQQEPAEIPAQP